MENIVLIPVTLAIAIPVEEGLDTAYVADAVNEILREQQRSFAPGSAMLDYSFSEHDARRSLTKSILLEDEVYEEGSAL